MPMTRALRKRPVSMIVWLLVLGGCPKRFDPRAETVQTSPNREADHAYHEAKARAEIGDHKDARQRFAEFQQKFPEDPLIPSARLGEARASLKAGDAKHAIELLEPMAAGPPQEAATLRSRHLYGMALHASGDFQRSRELLRPFAPDLAGDDAVELHAVLADDAAQLGDVEDALREYSAFWNGARPAERLYIRDRVSEMAEKLSSMDTFRLYKALPHDGVAAAYLGRRLIAERRAAGDEATAKEIVEETRGAREPAAGRVDVQDGARALRRRHGDGPARHQGGRAHAGGAGARLGLRARDGAGVRRRGARGGRQGGRRSALPRVVDDVRRAGQEDRGGAARRAVRARAGDAAGADRAAAGVDGRDRDGQRQGHRQDGAAVRHRRRAQRQVPRLDGEVSAGRGAGAGLLRRPGRPARRGVRRALPRGVR